MVFWVVGDFDVELVVMFGVDEVDEFGCIV